MAHIVQLYPNRNYLWILSRQRQMNDSTYESILSRIAAQGFDIQKLKRTVHKP